MKSRIAAFCAAITLLSSTSAQTAERESVSTIQCGGIVAEQTGYRDGQIISRAMEQRIVNFVQEAALTPGLAIAIVKDSEVAYLRGVGFRNLDDCAPVTPQTRFYLKSATKSFNGMLAALLHEEGVVELDAPITEYLPDLILPAPLNPNQVSLRAHFTQTLSYHDSGLQFRTVHFGNIADEDFVAHVNTFSEPRTTKFRYSNFGPMMGAHALGAATNSNWRDLIETKIFAPAGMNSSFTYVEKSERENAASSYVAHGGDNFTPTITKHEVQMVAAGGSYSTVEDLARWLILNLDDGVIDGEQVYPKRAVEQAHARQVQLDWQFYEFRRFAHGLGIYHSDYEDDNLMHHFGGETHVSFMPEHGIGVAVLTNSISGGAYVTHRVAALIYDELLGKGDVDARWRKRLAEIEDSLTRRKAQIADHLESERSKAPKGARQFPISDLVGVYSDPRLGDAVVSIKGGESHVKIGLNESAAEWVSGDGYLVNTEIWADLPDLWIFRHNDQGEMVIDWGGRIFTRSP